MADWFRNEEWNDPIAEAFDRRLARARVHSRPQYLRIQANTLATNQPEAALQLLDRYFETGDQFDRAQAFVDRATALRALDRTDEALDALSLALKEEVANPGVITVASVWLPLLVARTRERGWYPFALSLRSRQQELLLLPVHRFESHAAYALIADDLRDKEQARVEARLALAAAAESESGLRYHRSLGLVGAELDELVERMNAILGSSHYRR